MNEKMSLNLGEVDPPSPTPYSTPFESPESGSAARPSAARIAEVKMWLASQFHEVGKHVPDFDYTPQSISYLHNVVTLSQAQTEAATIVLNDFHHKSAEYRAQAARMREVLEKMGLAKESLPPKLVASAHVLANVANLLDIRDTELSSFLVAAFDLSQRKAEAVEKRAQAQQESRQLLDFTRKALARLAYLKRTMTQLENDIAPSEAETEHWKTNMAILDKKETQYLLEYSNYKKMLDRLSYSPEIRHGVLVEMADHRKELQKKTKPILESLRSYHDLPPDRALAALAIEEKKRQFAAAEKYLEDVLQSAIPE
ncbi:AUGMIN subunit 1-like [Salvia miltiorrhiza]|uniref:AUGMIN subunit 1-like n=1 Tax=Salvia miltiorrhiza TaxID=226208 RepID=UPI0025AC4B56|nr:AUGMIN subunit 1-like [Salvia miltiorrhiza]XP_057784968.1 AUGMIN subunit 1-like [Salvia miltiorrhiza]